jgi:hypothetical protein
MLNKSLIVFDSNSKLSILTCNNFVFLFVETSGQIKFVKLETFFEYRIEKNTLEVLNRRVKSKIFNCYMVVLRRRVKHIFGICFAVLFLRGLGLKIVVNNLTHCLELKVGFSHILRIKIPVYVTKIVALKKKLIVVGSYISKFNDFLKKLKLLRKSSAYKVRGFFFKNESVRVKAIKKK